MQPLALELCLLNLSLIGLLPVFFFERGRLNLYWWLTALPFFLCAAGLFVAALGHWPVASSPALGFLLAAFAVALCALSIGIIAYAVGSHVSPVALWHQVDVVPTTIVTGKAYRRVRHPLYAAFILALLAAALCVPSPLMWAVAAWGTVALNLTAHAEERRLLASPRRDAYRVYMASTGRLLPRWLK